MGSSHCRWTTLSLRKRCTSFLAHCRELRGVDRSARTQARTRPSPKGASSMTAPVLTRFDTVVVPLMNTDEARACVARINEHMNGARSELLRLYEGRGWAAMGYASWRECVTAEFEQSQSVLYAQLQAAEIERRISDTSEKSSIPLRQLLPLAQLTPMEQPIAWQEANQRSNGKPTARVVEQ